MSSSPTQTCTAYRSTFRSSLLQSAFIAPLLLWPAIHNGAPLLYSDSACYFDAIHGFDSIYRAQSYAFAVRLVAAAGGGLWCLIVLQAWLLAWAALSAARAVVSAGRAFAVVLLGASISCLPWFASFVLADVFTAVAALAFAVICSRWGSLTPVRRAAWTMLFTFSAGSHLSIPLSLTVALPAWLLLSPRRALRPLLCLALAFAAVPAFRWIVSGRAAYSGSGGVFLAARLADDGLLAQYLEARCQSVGSGELLCRYPIERARVRSWDFLWNDPHPYLKEAGWESASGEFWAVSMRVIAAYPAEFIRGTLRHSLRLFTESEDPEELLAPQPALEARVRRDFPSDTAAFHSSLQERGTLADEYRGIHRYYRLVYLSACLIGSFAALRRRRDPPARMFLFLLAFAAANALVCGAISGPFTRLESRVSWLVVLWALLLPAARRQGDDSRLTPT